MPSVTENPDWSAFVIPEITNDDYGYDWPEGTPQLVKELTMFRTIRENYEDNDTDDAFMHALRICMLLWDDELVSIRRNGSINTYFLDCMYELCRFKHLAITGPASSGKTYSSAVFLLISFYCSPDRTSVLVSTTARQDSERRVWGDIKKLHRGARFTANGLPEIGEVIEHAGCIVYNPAKIANKDFNLRDFRNGLMVVPTGGDTSGEEALNKIMGTKNGYVYWMVDEGPAMPAEIMAPRTNLSANYFFQFIMVGNASYKTDPHGRACEPEDGWSSVTPNMRFWVGKTLNVLFLHGEKSPNDLFQSNVSRKRDLNYPTLSNRFMREEIAKFAGDGNIEYGRNTQYYWRFAIGFWMGSDDQQTVLSEAFIKTHGADKAPEPWGRTGVRVFGGFDPGFTAGGDANSIFFIHVGYTVRGKLQVMFESDTLEIRPAISDNKDFNRAVADVIVNEAKNKRLMNISDFGGDVSADGGISFNEIHNSWGLIGAQLLSSNEESSSSRYASRVSQYWMQIRDLISSGYVRGFNCNSRYAKDLFKRRFVSEQKTFKIEKKKDMKKRTGRSPDNGDACSYTCHLVLTSGVISKSEDPSARMLDEGERVQRYYRSYQSLRRPSDEEEDYELDFSSSLEG